MASRLAQLLAKKKGKMQRSGKENYSEFSNLKLARAFSRF